MYNVSIHGIRCIVFLAFLWKLNRARLSTLLRYRRSILLLLFFSHIPIFNGVVRVPTSDYERRIPTAPCTPPAPDQSFGNVIGPHGTDNVFEKTRQRAG